MSAQTLIERLEKVKQNGTGNWIARCPAHPDSTPSLTVSETPEGVVLVHCFAGCSVHSIAEAAGITLNELFPPRQQSDYKPPQRRSFPAADVLAMLDAEARVVILCAYDIRNGRPVDSARLETACERIAEGRRLAGI